MRLAAPGSHTTSFQRRRGHARSRPSNHRTRSTTDALLISTLGPRSWRVLVASLFLLGSGRVAQAQEPWSPDHTRYLADRVIAGGTVHVGPGAYVFETGWRLDNDLALIGAGSSNTVVTIQAPPEGTSAAITWSGAGKLLLHGLRVDYVGATPADVVLAESDRTHCTIWFWRVSRWRQ